MHISKWIFLLLVGPLVVGCGRFEALDVSDIPSLSPTRNGEDSPEKEGEDSSEEDTGAAPEEENNTAPPSSDQTPPADEMDPMLPPADPNPPKDDAGPIPPPPADEEPPPPQIKNPKILVFSKTKGYRHRSISTGRKALKKIADKHSWEIEFTEDASEFSMEKLANKHLIIFLCTTGDILNSRQQRAMEEFIRSGKGFVGIHSAVDTEYGWSWYGDLIAQGYFESHPSVQDAEISFENTSHMAQPKITTPFIIKDEFYDLRKNPRPHGATILQSVSEDTYKGGKMGDDHPVSWARTFDGGRSFVTTLGHTDSAYSNVQFLEIVEAGMFYSLGIPAQ